MAEDYPDYGEWFQNQHPYPDLDEDEITSGVRSKAWLPCQYWITGMAVTCKYWQEGDPGNHAHGGIIGPVTRPFNRGGFSEPKR